MWALVRPPAASGRVEHLRISEMSYICGAGSDSAPHPRIGARASATGRALACQTSNLILDICIMKFRMDALHYALLAVVVLLAVYAFGSFKEGVMDSVDGIVIESGQRRVTLSPVTIGPDTLPKLSTRARASARMAPS